MGKNIKEVTDNDFDQEVLESDDPVLVDFWATWCGPCKALAPTLEKLSESYQGKVKFVKVDVDQNPEKAAQYGVRSIPTLVFFSNGKIKGQLVGNVSSSNIETLIRTV